MVGSHNRVTREIVAMVGSSMVGSHNRVAHGDIGGTGTATEAYLGPCWEQTRNVGSLYPKRLGARAILSKPRC